LFYTKKLLLKVVEKSKKFFKHLAGDLRVRVQTQEPPAPTGPKLPQSLHENIYPQPEYKSIYHD